MQKLIYLGLLVFGGGLGFWLGAQQAASTRVELSNAQLSAGDTRIDEERVRRLEQKLEGLTVRVQALARRPSTMGRAAASASAIQAKSRPASLSGTSPDKGETGPPNTENFNGLFAQALDGEDSSVRAGLVDLVRGELETFRAERGEVRRAWREARDEERLDSFAAKGDLSDEQRSGLEAILGEERESVRALYQAARENYDFRGARTQHEQVKAASDERIRDVLDDEQFDQWEALRTERRRRR